MCENLCIALNNAGEKVIAVSLYSEHSAITKRLEGNGVQIEFLGKNAGPDFSTFIKLIKLMKREKPDVVHTHIYASKYGLPAAALAGVKKKVHTVHNMAQEEQGTVGKIVNYLMYHFCGVIPVALSPEVRKSVGEVYGLSENVIPAIYNGIDLSRCIPKEKYEKGAKFTILHIGRFMEVKNHEILIRAFAKLASKYNDVRLQLIGEGKLFCKMKELVENLHIADKVEFVGSQPDVYTYLHNASIFCLPSKYEGMPMTLIEAMGTGLPIIASNVGGIPDMLVDKESALLIQPRENELEKAMELLYCDTKIRQTLGVAAKKRSKDFSAREMAAQYRIVYKEP